MASTMLPGVASDFISFLIRRELLVFVIAPYTGLRKLKFSMSKKEEAVLEVMGVMLITLLSSSQKP